MTHNQISYVSYLENQRHNLAMETLNRDNLDELRRHNTVSESQAWSSIIETARANKAREAFNWASLDESIRHNRAGESISWYQAQENARHNKELENATWYNYFTQRYAQEETATNNAFNRDISQKRYWMDYQNSMINAVKVGAALGAGLA